MNKIASGLCIDNNKLSTSSFNISQSSSGKTAKESFETFGGNNYKSCKDKIYATGSNTITRAMACQTTHDDT